MLSVKGMGNCKLFQVSFDNSVLNLSIREFMVIFPAFNTLNSITLDQHFPRTRMLQIINTREHNFCVNKVLQIECNFPGCVRGGFCSN